MHESDFFTISASQKYPVPMSQSVTGCYGLRLFCERFEGYINQSDPYNILLLISSTETTYMKVVNILFRNSE